jgi:hypothetical protein
MVRNKVQFPHGMSLSEFTDIYGIEAKREAAVKRSRWPAGSVCPVSGECEHSRFLANDRRYRQCARCRTQSTVRSGTLFHARRLPLTRFVKTFIAYRKTAIGGTCHRFDFHKYRHRYPAEAQYRVNLGFDLHSLAGRLVNACAGAEPCPEEWLRLAAVRAT